MACILIAHENIDIRELFEYVLSAQYQVITAQDGAQAIKLFDRYEPDIVIVHTSLPIVGGYTIIKHIRATKLPVKIIATSSTCERKYEHKTILEAGANICISTPIDLQELLSVVADLKMTENVLNFDRTAEQEGNFDNSINDGCEEKSA
jgi:DNA-binding response OmpR family regulator